MICFTSSGMVIDNLRPNQNVSHFAGDIFKLFFINENFCILMQIWLFVPKGALNNKPSTVQIMTWCWLGDKPLSALMMD